MAVSTGVPENWNLPLFWASVDGSKAGNLTQVEPAILVGEMFTTGGNAGTATPNVAVPVGSVALAGQMFGVGSMLYRMVVAFLACNTTQELWALPVTTATGVAASGKITFTAGPTASGLLSLYIAGQLVQISVASTDTPALMATNLTAAINAMTTLPVTAHDGGTNVGEVDLTCQWNGLTGNDITLIFNYRGVYGGEAFPPGVAVTIVAMSSGLGEPVFTNAISAIQAQAFAYVAFPYSDTASMSAWATEYGFGQTGRWSYTRQQYGFCINAYRNDYADALTWGLAQNQPVISTMAIEQQVPSPVWEVAAAYVADAALGFTDDPARPLQTLEMLGLLPAQLQYRFSQAQLNSLTNSGFAIQATNAAGNMFIMREQTQYQLNAYGQSDTAFGLLTTLATLAALLSRMKSAITSKYPRVKLVPDGTKLGPGQAAVTPTIIKGELVSEFQQAMYDGLVADLPDFLANLVVEIDDTNPSRLNVLWPPQLAGQLRVFSALAQFRLLYPTQSPA